MEYFGYFAMVVVGVTLGLLGGGGAILTVPIMVYLFSVPAILATTYSLFVVGVSSLYGVVRYQQKQMVDYRVAIVFALPSFLGIFLSRQVFIPRLPEVIFELSSRPFTKDDLVLTAFAIVMLGTSTSMIRSGQKNQIDPQDSSNTSFPLLAFLGLVVGVVAGFVGAGGGFLIIPALVLFANIPMNKTVGTSLLIIAANSIVGFSGDFLAGVSLDFSFLTRVTLLAFIGIFIGTYFSRFFPAAVLKKMFGWLVLVMGVFVLFMQT